VLGSKKNADMQEKEAIQINLEYHYIIFAIFMKYHLSKRFLKV